jgi:ABC-type nitrate/sulfonate/bicarbonate transport system permease component
MKKQAHLASETNLPLTEQTATGFPEKRAHSPRRYPGVTLKHLVLYIVGPLSVIVLWEYVGRQGLLAGGLFPPFTQVLMAWSEWIFGIGGVHSIYSGTWLLQAMASTERVLLGFVIGSAIAIVVGILVGWSAVFDKLIDPSVNLIRPISVTAWIPLALIIFGIGDRPAIFLTVLATFFPVYINTVAGVRQAEEKLTRAARMLGVNDFQLLTRVVLPAALPNIFTGMRVAVGIAWTTVVVAEMLGAKSGLGYVLIDAYNFFEFPYVIAAMFSIGLLGFLTDRILLFIINWQLYWVEKGAAR